jgi:nucleoside-diphosphate-sugar epimerase
MRILVTGAAGFIGSHVCDWLVRDGHEVVGIDGFIPYYPRAIKEANLRQLAESDLFQFVEADLRSADLTPLIADTEVVVHLAAMAGSASWDTFDEYVTCNLSGTKRLLEALCGVDAIEQRRLVQISTSSVYGAHATGMEDAPLQPVSPYGVTKLAAEHLAFAYHRVYGIPVVALRYFSIYGPRQRPDMAYHRFIDAMLSGNPITIYGDGEQTRGNTFIDDCVRGTVDAISRGHPGEAYNLGGGVPVSLNHAIEILEDAIGVTAVRNYLPARLGDQRHTLANVSKAHDHFGYVPQIDPREGLPRQAEWQRRTRTA